MTYRITRPTPEQPLVNKISPAIRTIGPARESSSGSSEESSEPLIATPDQQFSSTTPGNIVGLSFPVTAGEMYWFNFFLVFQSDTLACGLRLSATFPALTAGSSLAEIRFAAAGSDAIWAGSISSSGTAIVATDVHAINQDLPAKLEGLIVPSANGTFQLQAGLEVAGAIITVKRGIGFVR